MALGGMAAAGIAVGFFKRAFFGVDPFQCFCNGINQVIPIGFGTLYMLINAVLLVIDFFLDRHYIGISTFINLFLLGYAAEFSEQMLAGWFGDPGIGLRIAFLVIGIVVSCIAAAFYYTADLGVSTYDAIAISLNRRREKSSSKFFRRWRFATIRIACDVLCVLIGALLCYLYDRRLDMAGALFTTMGVGTIITAFFMGPLISFFNRTVAEPLLKKT